jgi:hypothetical protein
MQTKVAEKFTTFPGKCFRYSDAETESAQPCRNRVVRTGAFTDSSGKKWTVDACAEHAEELTGQS